MNADIEVTMQKESDAECANIRIRCWGSITELRFNNGTLRGVAVFDSVDICRLLKCIKEAEKQRIDPDSRLISSLECVIDGVHWSDESQTRLRLEVEAEMPVASCGSVLLKPNLKGLESESSD